MSELAAELAATEHLWRSFVRHDDDARFYQQLYRDPNLDVWLICWVDGQSTGYHDHDRSSGAVCVCEGKLFEDWFRVEEDGWVRERTTEHGPAAASTSTPRTSTASDTQARARLPRRRSTSTPPHSGGWATTSPAHAGCAGSG